MVGELPILQQSPAVESISAAGLVGLFVVPILGLELVPYVTEGLLDYPEYKSFTVTSFILLALTVLVGPLFDQPVALGLERTVGLRVGLRLGHPLTIYWGIWTGLSFLTAYDEWKEYATPRPG